MRKYIRVLVLIIIFCVSKPSSAEIENRNFIIVISPTTGIFSGIRLGFGVIKLYEKDVWEFTLNYDNELYPFIKGKDLKKNLIETNYFDSFYFQANKFWNKDREEIFLKLKLGITLMPSFPFSYENESDDDFIMGVLTIGTGYSFNIKDKLYIRPSFDIGLQSKIISAEVAFTF
ncbi:MAG: hypothetical protein APR54_00015 [Candidatus Cloacimonas sp. SDB]|nr:MAG: hypothetical protein APR54_00015 [Candidatus Cloacimonas sp. SDB]